jgi:predicted nucleotidyltransferase
MKALAAEGRTVFVSSHLMSEMENTADHLIVIGRGKLIADCTVAEFIAAKLAADGAGTDSAAGSAGQAGRLGRRHGARRRRRRADRVRPDRRPAAAGHCLPGGPCSRPICESRSMDTSPEALTAEAAAVLGQAGARFAYLHGSRASGQSRADSDIDIAAHFGGRPPNAFDLLLPSGVDLLILDDTPLELAGRVAVGGRLLFEHDQVARVRWEAMTRKIYFDELPRITRSHREFAAAVTARAR